MKDTEQSATVEGTLRSAGVRVLVVGSGEYPPESALPAIPAVASTVSTLAATLTSRCGVPITHLKTLSDPVGPAEFGEALATIAAEADDVFVLYFVGHGLVSPGGELYLATAATRDPTAPTLGLSALAYSTLRDILRTACRARSVVIVLDCCFSGRAHRSVTAAAADGFELAATGGGYVLTSAAADEAALAPPGRPLTAFSEALCKLLTDGNPVGRPWISLEDAFLYLRRELPARGIPAPRRSQNGVVGRLVLAANPAAAPVLSLEPPAPHPEPGDSELPCPYLGLAPYTGDDARYFFGRKDTVDKVLDRIALHIDDGPLILIGVSGVGKSSLVAAGIVPAIRRGELRGAGRWSTLTCTPGPRPLETLAARLAVVAGTAIDAAIAELRADPDGVEELVLKGLQRGASVAEGARLLLVVDQFEELFTLCDNIEERRRFVTILDRASRSGAVVVLTLRADFYPQCMAHPELVDALAHRQIPIEPMSSTQLRKAIQTPAALTGLILEHGLMHRVLKDLAGSDFSDASLPLLSYAMQQTWIRRNGDTLTLAGYEATGGVRDAVTRQADAAFDGLTPAGQNAMRRLLLRMVRVGTDVEDTRCTIDLGELLRENPAETRWITAARDALAERRLITVDDQHAWITHDALLRAWPRLRRWIDEDRDGLILHHRLIDDAQTWNRNGRRSEELYRGQRLAAARAWDRNHPNQLGPLEQRFLRAATRGRRRTLVGTVAAVMAAVLAVAATGIAINQHRSDMRAATIANSRKLAQTADDLRTNDPVTAEQLSLAAYRTAPTPEARAAVLASDTTPLPVDIPSHGGKPVLSLTVSPDNKIVVSTGEDHTVRLWDITDARHPKARAVITNDSNAVAAFIPGTRLLVDQTHSALQMWDLTNPTTPAKLSEVTTSPSPTAALAVSPDGRTVATCGTNGIVRLWAIDDPHNPTLATEQQVNTQMLLSIAFDRHGTLLAIGSGAARITGNAQQNQADLILWNVTDRTHPQPLSTQPANSVEALTFSPTDDRLVAVGAGASILILDLTTPGQPKRLCDQDAVDGVLATSAGVRFVDAGHGFIVGNGNGSLDRWRLDTGRPCPTLVSSVPHAEGFTRVAVNSNNTVLAAGGEDGEITVWAAPDMHIADSFPAPLSGMTDFSSDGTTALGDSGFVNLIRSDSGDPTETLPDGWDPFGYVPGTRVAIAGDEATSKTGLWDVADPGHPRLESTIPDDPDRYEIALRPCLTWM